MSPADMSRPTAEEYIPYYAQYIDLVPDGDILETLERQIGESAAAWGALSAEQAQWRPAPGEWNALEIVGHLADAERIFSYRAMRIARADPTMWESIEVDDYVTNGGFSERTMPDLIAEYTAVRRATLALLRGLGPAAWARRMPDEWTTRSVRAIAWVLAGHELHHLKDVAKIR
jgi:hypothetical protein